MDAQVLLGYQRRASLNPSMRHTCELLILGLMWCALAYEPQDESILIKLFKPRMQTACMKALTMALFAVVASLAVAAMTTAGTGGNAMADEQESNITVTAISDEISVQKTTVVLSVPLDNALPWGFVTGQTSDHISDYPVIIQFHQDGQPVHFAQVDVDDDGSYEYRFRALSVDLETGQTVHIFQGQYDVSIFEVIPSPQTVQDGTSHTNEAV